MDPLPKAVKSAEIQNQTLHGSIGYNRLVSSPEPCWEADLEFVIEGKGKGFIWNLAALVQLD